MNVISTMFLLLAAERKNNLYVIKNRVIRRLRDFADNWQLFYKAGDDAHIQKMEAFKGRLREWARLLRWDSSFDGFEA